MLPTPLSESATDNRGFVSSEYTLESRERGRSPRGNRNVEGSGESVRSIGLSVLNCFAISLTQMGGSRVEVASGESTSDAIAALS